MIARLLGDRPSPSAALYLCNALHGAPGLRVRSHTVFDTDDAVVVVRHDAGAPVPRSERRRLIYVLDDAIFAGLSDRSLPLAYRAKLALVECASARRLLPRAETVVVSTAEVAEAIPSNLLRPSTAVVQIAPYWDAALSSLRHHAPGVPLRIGFTGGQTHAAMLTFSAPALAAVLAAHSDATLVMAPGHRPPASLRGHPRLRREGGSWEAYRSALPTLWRHIVLYPTPDTPFARARSVNKLIEHAIIGAAAIYSERWQWAQTAAAAGAGLVAPHKPAAWRDAAMALAADPALARQLAQRALALAARLNDPAAQRALWWRLLGLAPLIRAPLSGSDGTMSCAGRPSAERYC